MTVKLTPHAKQRLREIYEYYKTLSKGKYGRKVRAKILDKARMLKEFPSLGQLEESLKDLGLEHRYLLEGDHKIIYYIFANTVWIADIFDTRQDPGKMTGQ